MGRLLLQHVLRLEEPSRTGTENPENRLTTDSVLTGYHTSVCKPSGDMMREVADDRGQHSGFRFVDATHDGKEVNCGFEGAGEQTGSGEKQVSYGRRLEIESRGRGPVALEDLEVKMR